VGAALVTVIGFDFASATLAEADNQARELRARLGLGEEAVICTHLIRDDHPHVALSVAVPGEDAVNATLTARHAANVALTAGAAEAVAAHTARTSGRAVVYPGVDALTGTVTVGAILAGSAIDEVVVLAGAEPPGLDDLVQTRDHVRPEWRAGRLTLTVTPVAPGVFAPFEVPNPTPCCADHSNGQPGLAASRDSGAPAGLT
jgi:hypothetical protein